MNETIIWGLTVGNALAFLGGGVGVSIMVELLKKVFGLESGKVVQFVVITLSFAVTALDYVISVAHNNPAVLAGHAAAILGIANAAHTFLVGDASAFVGKVRSALADEAANAPAQPTTSTTGTSMPAPAPPNNTVVINNSPPLAASGTPATPTLPEANF